MKKVFKKIFNVLLVAFVLWLIVCYGEILCKNVNSNPQYSNWNILVNTIEGLSNFYNLGVM